jgi:hypothetical protein
MGLLLKGVREPARIIQLLERWEELASDGAVCIIPVHNGEEIRGDSKRKIMRMGLEPGNVFIF